MPMRRRILAISLLLAGFGQAKEKDHDWKKGTLVATDQSREMAGSHAETAGTYARPLGLDTDTAMLYRTWRIYVIQGEGYTFKVQCTVRPRKRLFVPAYVPNVTVNGPLHYAFEEGKFFLLDEDGKYFEMTVLEKALAAKEAVRK